jgi:hypothetical protein
MPRTGVTYEKPSRVSQGLIVCFSIAVAVMAGWLVMTIMFADNAKTRAAGEADVQTPNTRPDADNVSPEPIRLSSTAGSSSAYLEPSPSAYAPDSTALRVPPAPPRSTLPPASPAELPPVGARDPAYTASSVLAAVPDANYRGVPADEPPQVEAVIDTDTNPEVIPLPPRRPRYFASIPVPRARPHPAPQDAQPSADQSFFEFQVNRQR